MTEEELKKIKEAYADIKTAMYHLNKAIDWDAEIIDDELMDTARKWAGEIRESSLVIEKGCTR